MITQGVAPPAETMPALKIPDMRTFTIVTEFLFFVMAF